MLRAIIVIIVGLALVAAGIALVATPPSGSPLSGLGGGDEASIFWYPLPARGWPIGSPTG